MAGAFSGQLIDSYHTGSHNRPTFAPFGQDPSASHISMNGPLSWNSSMHGSFQNQPSFSLGTDQSYTEPSEASALKIAQLQTKLNRKLGPEYISQRPGPGGGPKLTYAEGWKIINLANEVFGFNGWSSTIVSLTVDFCDVNEETKRINVGVTAIVRVTLRDGAFHEDVGHGSLENSKSKAQALDKCKKEAVTDGIKRALRNFGNLLGNCLYDKEYSKEIVKVKVPPSKFDRSELHRRPEFAEQEPAAGPSTSMNTSSTSARPDTSTSFVKPEPPTGFVKPEPGSSTNHARPASAMPMHMRPPGAAASRSHSPMTGHRPAATSTPKGKGPEQAAPPAQARPANGTGPPAPPTDRRVAFAPNPARPPSNPPHPASVPTPAPAQAAPAPVHAPTENASGETVMADDVPADDADDSFSLYNITSDDDAYLAAVELGGIGGPIYLDEGSGAAEPEPEPEPEPEFVLPPAPAAAAPSRPAVPPGVREGSGERAGQRSNGRVDRLSLIAAAIGGAGADEEAQPMQAHQPQQQRFVPAEQGPAASTSSAVGAGSTRQHSLQRQNPAAPGGAQMELSTSTSRMSPSMGGGFNFPAGFTPPTVQRPTPGQQSTNAPSTSGTNLKRNSDVMQAASAGGTSGRRPAQGMGLTHQPAPGGNGGGYGMKREPLTNSHASDGGDLKRMRR